MSFPSPHQAVAETVDTDGDTVEDEEDVAVVHGTVSTEAETVENEAQPIPTGRPDDTVDTPTRLLFHITCDSTSDSEKLLKFLPRGVIKKDSREHVTIGRRETNDLRLNHPQANRDIIHITPPVKLGSDLPFTIQNLTSKGLSVNNIVLEKGAESPLTTGNVIKLDWLSLEMEVEVIQGDDDKVYEVQFCHKSREVKSLVKDCKGVERANSDKQPQSVKQSVPICENQCTSDNTSEQNEHLCGRHIQPPLQKQHPTDWLPGTASKSVEKQASLDSVHELIKQVSLESSSGSGSVMQIVLMGSNINLNMGAIGSDETQQGLPNTGTQTDFANGEGSAVQESGEGDSQSLGSEERNPIQETESSASTDQPIRCSDSSENSYEECTKIPLADTQGGGGFQPTVTPVENDDRDTFHAKESKTSQDIAQSVKPFPKVNPNSSVADTVDTPTRLTLVVQSDYSGLDFQYPTKAITKPADQPFLIGRNEKADVQIWNDQRVSHKHMQIEALSATAGLGFQLRKLKKNKIVFVNGERVEAETPVELRSGSMISLQLPGSPAVKVEFGVQIDVGDAMEVYEVLVKRK